MTPLVMNIIQGYTEL
uniref:Uncharacterized protein n=1 Tax=Anguilla anguilla TaxID=7936 RepID=A0A0E9V2T2_ANGAN